MQLDLFGYILIEFDEMRRQDKIPLQSLNEFKIFRQYYIQLLDSYQFR